MANTITSERLSAEIDALTRLATVVLNEHTNLRGMCAVCGCAFPCERAVLAESSRPECHAAMFSQVFAEIVVGPTTDELSVCGCRLDGADRPSVTLPAIAMRHHLLRGLLVCDGCDLPLCPLISTDGRRCYRSPCGYRLRPVDAATVERLTYDALDRRALLPADGALDFACAALFGRALCEVRVGAVPDELVFVWRT